jgi:2-polyprenyl-3-methyl-5-hydroxy-6-metoxy-1,4-benzoquinol methylase
MAEIALTADDETKVEEFAGNLFMAGLAAMELANVELGVRLGLYETLAGAGAVTPSELAQQAKIGERYAREWLEQQAVAGVLEVDEARTRFTLPNAHAHVLIDDDSEACMKPVTAIIPWLKGSIDIMEQAFRTGEGVAFGDFDLHDIQAAFTRPAFVNHLTQAWLPALPDVQVKLDSGAPIRIAEVGCGEGLAAIVIAKAYPNATIDGYDLDTASIAAAQKAGADAGVGDRVRFEVRDAADPKIEGNYDLVLSIEMLHDVPDPIGILTTMKRLAGEAGAMLVVDERTEDGFAVPATEMERLFYAFSTLHCLAVSLQDDGVGTGTVIRESDVRRYAEQAGLTVETLDVDHPQFRLYRLR